MLEKPDLPAEEISASLLDNYGLVASKITFLPLGADQGTAVYHAIIENENEYFVKLRQAPFNQIAITLPKYLSDQGIAQIIAPLPGKTGKFSADLSPFELILYPFIAGHNAYEVNLADSHWFAFGQALRQIHNTPIPTALIKNIQRENYSPRWRSSVRAFLERIADESYHDPVTVELADFLRLQREKVLDLVARAEKLAHALQARSPEIIVCHSDIHAGNIHISTDGALYIVDWDAPILAPKERDLMAVGAGLMGGWRSPAEEETLFYHTYGSTEIDPLALAYYRYERIIEDIALFCQQLLSSDDGGDDRAQSLHYLKSNFLPDSTIEIAYASDKSAP